jgi:RimJ/RimL family protein N-acetyltransferase
MSHSEQSHSSGSTAMPDLSREQITTDRLLLVPVSYDYEQETFEEFTPEITTYMFPTPPTVIEDTREFIKGAQESAKNGQAFYVSVLNKETKEFLGGAGLHGLHNEIPELGIWIKKAAHGNGYGKEAIMGLIEWAKKNTTATYLNYPVDRDNIPSRKIPESLGAEMGDSYEKKTPRGVILHTQEYRIQLRK